MKEIICLALLVCFSGFAMAKNSIAIMDFSTSDVESRKYLQHTDKPFLDSDEPVLSDSERAVLSQAELAELTKSQIAERIERSKAEREVVDQRNRIDRQEKEDHRARTVTSALGREIIQAPELMAAALSQYDLFDIVDRKTVEEGIGEIGFQNSGLVNNQSATQLGQMTGAGYLLYGVVSDYGREVSKSLAYNTPVKSTTHSIELTVKIVETGTNKMVFSTVSTNQIQETKTGSGYDSSLMRKLLRGAIDKSAASINDKFSKLVPQPVVTVAVPKVLLEPKDASGQNINAEIEVDGSYAGNAPAEIELPSGNHTIKFTFGNIVWEKNIVTRDGMKLSPTLQ